MKIKDELEQFLKIEQDKLDISKDILKIDLHCHDKNSNKPSERLGRILGVPETWLETEDLLKCLKRNKTSVITITNHNNSRSCWELIDNGVELISGAEFTCKLPESKLSIHVLTYGFTPFQEVELNILRNNLYDFLRYCCEHDILTVWAHPLYFNPNKFSIKTVMELEHIATLFSHFEVINGQRNSRQNLITINWLKTFTPEKIDRISKQYSVNIHELCKNPYANYMVGGSDDHMGLFAGNSGTYIKVENLEERLKTATPSELALEGLKKGNIVPYGSYTEEHKMSLAFLELFYMIVKNMEDPGLIRMILHQGKKSEKLLALLITNGIAELRRHKFTLQFLKAFHNSLHGKGLDFWQQAFVKKSAKPLIQEIENISKSKSLDIDDYLKQTKVSLKKIFTLLNKQVVERWSNNIKSVEYFNTEGRVKLQPILEKIEIPAIFRTYLNQDENIDIGKLFDKLSFPVLASGIIAGVVYASTKVLHDNREFLDFFAQESGMEEEPKRLLWLTDTLVDKNGIALSLSNYREEVISQNLPIDFLVCHESLESGENLIVTKPIGTFPIPMYKEQIMRIPNILEIHGIFKKGNYDRILCSTELMMGVVGLYLKSSFNVPAYFFMHTDWLEFSKRSLELSESAQSRVTRFSRTFYKSFDKLFVLNRDNKEWLTGRQMKISSKKIEILKHWVSPIFKQVDTTSNLLSKSKDETILLYVGRISEEKGLLDFRYILERVKEDIPNCRAVFVGKGPYKSELMEEIPDATFIDWVSQEELPSIYSLADFLVFPSRFDTFGRVVLESISCGCPVAAYNVKGPKDIIQNEVSGILSNNKYELAEKIVLILQNKSIFNQMKKDALLRSKHYSKDKIIDDILEYTNLKKAVKVPVL